MVAHSPDTPLQMLGPETHWMRQKPTILS